MTKRTMFVALACTVAATSTLRGQERVTMQPPPPSGPPTVRAEARPWHVRAIFGSRLLEPDSMLAVLEREHFSAAYMKQTTRADRLELVRQVRAVAATAALVRAQEDDAGVHMKLDDREVFFTIEQNAPFGIASMRLVEGTAAAGPSGTPLTWETLADRLKAAESDGFAGQVLVRRQGKEALRATYGFADKSANRRSKPDDMYCIGSTPIDFTVTAARLLIERGKLLLDDPIGKYVKGVPADKAGMTIRMILERRSGLPNFHHLPTDADHDLTWIDRENAVKRIVGMSLLFPPGERNEPSHSAFGLLAAIVEIASGSTYQEFVTKEILKPLGMTRTGFYGETLGLPETAFATGYGPQSFGTPNIPPKWGRTSWLVMGSGGMVSTLDDLVRYYDGVAAGKLFKDNKSGARMGISVNGSDRGFYFTSIDNGKGDQVYLLSNTESSPTLQPLTRGIVQLVMPQR